MGKSGEQMRETKVCQCQHFAVGDGRERGEQTQCESSHTTERGRSALDEFCRIGLGPTTTNPFPNRAFLCSKPMHALTDRYGEGGRKRLLLHFYHFLVAFLTSKGAKLQQDTFLQ